MFAYLKDNAFFLRLENDGLFLKNNFSDINVATPKSYILFQKLIRYLDGHNDVDMLIDSIENESVKKFYRELLNILKEQRFVLYDDKEIDISKYSDYEKQLLYYFGDLKEWKGFDYEKFFIEIEGAHERIIQIFEKILGNRMNVKSRIIDNNYICVKLYYENKVIKNLYIYKKNEKRELIISTNKPVIKPDISMIYLPLHVYEVMGGIMEIEIWLMMHNAPVRNFFDEDYIFDLDMLNGRHVDREYEDAS